MSEKLTERDKQIIGECLIAFVDVQFIPDWEFPIICHFNRQQMAQIVAAWPDDENSENMQHAIGDALLNLTGYPHGKEEELAKRVSAPLEEVEAVCEKWFRIKYPKKSD